MRTLFLADPLHSRVGIFLKLRCWWHVWLFSSAGGGAQRPALQGAHNLSFGLWDFGAEIVVGGNVCNGVSRKNFIRTLPSLYIHDNCLAIAPIWLDLWLGTWLYGFDFDPHQGVSVSQVSPLDVRMFSPFSLQFWTCFGGELGHCRHSSLRSGCGCEGPGLGPRCAMSDYVRQMERSMNIHAACKYISGKVFTALVKWCACIAMYVLCSSFGHPQKCAGKSAKKFAYVFASVISFSYYLTHYETYAKKMHTSAYTLHMFCMSPMFSVFWNICRTYAKNQCTSWNCFSIFPIFGKHQQCICKTACFMILFAQCSVVHVFWHIFIGQESRRNRKCQTYNIYIPKTTNKSICHHIMI